MRLESALNTSREGITAHGQAIAVVGDNIANANTTAYKTARAEFVDLLGEASGDRSSDVVSGAGDGVAVKSVRVIQENGIIEPTGRDLDVGIAGGGFFLVGDPADPQFTRSGNFEIDKDGFLTTSNGLKVLGYSGADTTTVAPIDMYAVKTNGVVTTNAELFGNICSAAKTTTAPTGTPTYKDIAAAQTYGATQAVYDTLGQRHEVQLAFFRTGNGAWTAQAYIDGGDVGGTEGQPILLGSAALKFGTDGQIAAADKAGAKITAAPKYANGAAAGNFTIDIGSMTQFAGGSGINNVTQDGQGNGSVSQYQFDSDGKIFAILDNGTRSQVGALPLATFRNVDGLQRSGTGVYIASPSAGEVEIASAGNGQLGTVEGNSLERSTVDIASQFINLVLLQRGYQANSQIMGAANELLQSTIGLIR